MAFFLKKGESSSEYKLKNKIPKGGGGTGMLTKYAQK